MKIQAAALMALPLLLSACGSTTVAEQPPAIRVQSGESPDLLVELPEEQVEDIEAARHSFERWAGDVADHQAAAVVRAYALNGGQAECLEAQGVDWAWQTGIVAAPIPTYYGNNIHAAPPERSLTFPYVVNAEAAHQEPVLHLTPPDDVARKIDECGSSSPGAGSRLAKMSEEELDTMVTPAGLDELSVEWKALLDEASASVGDPKTVIGCLETVTFTSGPLAGIGGKNGGEAWLKKFESSVEDGSKVPLAGDESTRDWDQALLIEEQMIGAMWECRGASMEAVRALRPRLKLFEETYAKEISDANATWARVQEIATSLGWTPDDPLANESTTDSAP